MSATYPPNPEPLAEAVQACLDGDMTPSGTIAHSEYFGERVAQVLKSAGWTYTPPEPAARTCRFRRHRWLALQTTPLGDSGYTQTVYRCQRCMGLLFTNTLTRRLRPEDSR